MRYDHQPYIGFNDCTWSNRIINYCQIPWWRNLDLRCFNPNVSWLNPDVVWLNFLWFGWLNPSKSQSLGSLGRSFGLPHLWREAWKSLAKGLGLWALAPQSARSGIPSRITGLNGMEWFLKVYLGRFLGYVIMIFWEIWDIHGVPSVIQLFANSSLTYYKCGCSIAMWNHQRVNGVH